MEIGNQERKFAMKRRYVAFILSLLLMFSTALSGCEGGFTLPSETTIPFSLSEVPAFTDDPYVEVNGNLPYFTTEDLTTESFEYYTPLDELGRCGMAYACIGLDLMPTGERGAIGMIKPTGWHTVRYDDLVDGKYLYNRCHLIGYQLSGENANRQNLITGTRYLNIDGMLPFENDIDDYVEDTGNHVLYRVTPIFERDNLLATGVLMEGYSVEDGGAGICFNVFAYNAQPGIELDYATGESRIEGSDQVQAEVEEIFYIGNRNSKKFHLPTCPNLPPERNQVLLETWDDAMERGYSPCGNCDP